MATSVLEKLESELVERRAKADAAFSSLAFRIAAGDEPGADRVREILDAAGRSIDDLRAAVQAAERRGKLLSQIATAETAEAERVELIAKIETETRKFRQAREKHAATIRPWQIRLREITDLLAKVGEWKKELLATCDDSIQAELSENMQERERIDAEVARLKKSIVAHESNIVGVTDDVQKYGTTSERTAALQHARKRIGEIQVEIDELHGRQAELVDQEAEILQRVYAE